MELFTYELSFDGNSDALNSPTIIDTLLDNCAKFGELTVVNKCSHQFSPQGYTSTYLLSESHIAVHTWPEKNKGYLVFSTCKKPTKQALEDIKDHIKTTLLAKKITVRQC